MDDEKKSEVCGDITPDETDEKIETAPKPDETDDKDQDTAENNGKESRGEKKKVRRLEAEIESLKKQLETANLACSAANDKYMRMIAEYDNFRKRSAKEREGCYSDAYADAVTAVLPVLDNLERAAQYSDAQSVAKGIELTLKSFSETFEKLGIKEIETIGKPFDPNLHNAVMHVEDENYGENEIVEVLQKGYTKGDKVIRYAMVKVAN